MYCMNNNIIDISEDNCPIFLIKFRYFIDRIKINSKQQFIIKGQEALNNIKEIVNNRCDLNLEIIDGKNDGNDIFIILIIKQ